MPSEVFRDCGIAILDSRFLDSTRNDSPKMSVVAYVHGRAHLYIVIKQFCAIRRLTDAAMRSGVAGQNSHVHADAFVGQTQEPSHRRAGEVGAARSRIDPGANSSTYHAARRVHKIAIQIRMVIRVFLKHVQVARRRLVSASAGRDWTIGHDLVVDHEVSALLRNRDDDVCIVRRRLFK